MRGKISVTLNKPLKFGQKSLRVTIHAREITMSKFTEKAEKALNNAVKAAEEYGHTYIGSEHILFSLGIDSLSCSFAILSKCGITSKKIESGIKEYSGIGIKSTLEASDMTPRCKSIIENSYKIATKYSSPKIGTEHILLSVLDEKDSVAIKILEYINADIPMLRDETVTFLRASDKTAITKKQHQSLPFLTQYGRNLNQLAKDGKLEPVIGREIETERLIRILSRKNKNNPCLIGEAGVGKTAIVEGLAKRISDGTVPEGLVNKIVFSVDLTSMIAGAKYRGDFEERIKSIISEASKNDYVILFIDEIHTIVGAGSAEGAIDAANILKPELSRSNIQLIGATTLSEYRRYIEKDPALERRFQPLMVEPTTSDATVNILKKLKKRYEKHHGVKIEDDALICAVKLSERYIQDRQLPDKALDLIDEACAKVNVKNAAFSDKTSEIENKLRQTSVKKEKAVISKNFEAAMELRREEEKYLDELIFSKETKGDKALTVTESDVKQVLSEITGIPSEGFDENEKYETLEEKLSAQIIGQQKAIKLLSSAVLRSKIGISDPKRPKGVFMFLGESGVGKTALAKALASSLFSEESALIRLDMSEFGENHSISKIIGSPPGYVGYEEGGALTEKIRRRPYSVILFDEIEKASESVQNLLLQIMDDGILTDSSGKKVSFRNTFIIMTSNIGADGLDKNQPLGFIGNNESKNSKAIDLLKKHLKPEFINRIDEIIPFSSLNSESLARISDLMLKKLKLRLRNIGVSFDYTEAVCDYVAKRGLTAGLGARPLSRIITNDIENKITSILVKEKYKSAKISIDINSSGVPIFDYQTKLTI